MPPPEITGRSVFKGHDDTTDGLDKRPDKKNKVTITGDNISMGDIVVVAGASGSTWVGKIDQVNGSIRCKNLRCIDGVFTSREMDTSEAKDDSKLPLTPENVSTTVINPTNGGSAPVPLQSVPIIP